MILKSAKAARQITYSVSERSVRSAVKVEHDGDESLLSAVDSGRIKVSVAAYVATLPKSEQAEIVVHGEQEILKAAKRIRTQRGEKWCAEVARIMEEKRCEVGHLFPHGQ